MTTIVTDDLVEYLRSKSLQPKQKTSTEVTIHCLDCEAGHEKKLGKLYINTETWLAFCQRCQATYNKRTLLRHFGDEVDETPEVRANEHKLEIYAQYVDLAHQHLLGNEKMLRYLIERGLDETTIIDARLGYSPKGVSLTRSLPGLDGDGWTIAQLQASGLLDGRGRDFFSQCITIPYLSRNQVLQVRGRDMAGGRGGRYLTMSGDRARIFGQDDLVQDKVTVVEGEFDCFDEATEVLTPKGWVAFGAYAGEQVAQYEESGALTFVDPIAFGRRHAEKRIHLYTEKTGGIDLVVTPGHRMVSMRPNGELRIHRVDQPAPSNHKVPRVGMLDGGGIQHSDDEIKLLLAIAADATIDKRRMDGRQYVRFGFSKERKRERLLEILDRLGIEYSSTEPRAGWYSICFRVPNYLEAFKRFPWEWVALASMDQRRLILSEMVEWDGNRVVNRTQVEFSSKSHEDAIWMQTIAHTAGRCSTIMHRTNQRGEWWKVSVLQKETSSWQAVKYSDAGPGDVYSVQVPSTMLIVRRNGQVTVTGNCLMLRQTLRLSSNPEHRQMGVIAFPGVAVWPGGNDNIAETLDGPSRVYIGFDPDEVGRREAAKLREALGTKSRVIKLPVDDTDWSDWLKSGENDVDDVWRLVTRAEMEGKRIFTPSETREAFLEMNEAGGIKLGWPSLDALIAPGPRPGNVIIPIAGTGCGKTSFLANIAWNLRDRRVLHITMENTAAEFYDVIRRIQSFHLPHSRESSVQEHLPYLRICQENRLRIADLDLLVAEYEEEVGAKPEVIQIDYLGYLANGFPGGSDYERVSAASFLLKELAKKHNLIVICPSQISRKAEAGKPLTIADAKDSSKIEDTADFAFGLFRPSEAAEKRLVGSASYHPEFTMQLLKSRRGNAGKWVQLMSAPKTLAMVDAKDQKAVSRVQTEVQAHNQGAALESIQSLHRRATEIQTVSDLGVAARRVSR